MFNRQTANKGEHLPVELDTLTNMVLIAKQLLLEILKARSYVTILTLPLIDGSLVGPITTAKTTFEEAG